MDQQSRRKNKTDDLSFKDSWLQNTVELAAIGAVVAGGANFAVKGNLDDVARHGKRAVTYATKALDRYVNRKMGPGTKILNNVGKKTLKNLKKHDSPNMDASYLQNRSKEIQSIRNGINEEEVATEAAKRMPFLRDLAVAKGRVKSPEDVHINIEKLKEEVRTEMTEKKLSRTSTKSNNKQKDGSQPSDWKKEFASSAIAGLGFGTGITAFHAIDRAISKNDNKGKKPQKRDDLFEASGSFLGRKDENKMNKFASVKGDLLNKSKQVVGEIPKTYAKKVVEGLGSATAFTGVSLGTAKVLNSKNEANEETKPGKGNRIIIELGENDPTKTDNAGHAAAGAYGMMPRVASQSLGGLVKLGKG